MSKDFPKHAAVSTSNDANVFGIWVAKQWNVRHHFVVRKLVPLRALDAAIYCHHLSVSPSFENRDALVFGRSIEERFIYLDAHGLTRPGTE